MHARAPSFRDVRQELQVPFPDGVGRQAAVRPVDGAPRIVSHAHLVRTEAVEACCGGEVGRVAAAVASAVAAGKSVVSARDACQHTVATAAVAASAAAAVVIPDGAVFVASGVAATASVRIATADVGVATSAEVARQSRWNTTG